MPKVSVIIPIYNMERYLKQSLESVVNQTLQDIEIICINDGSTDNSLSILEEFAQKDKRIKIINQENKGPGFARNRGIELASSEYIMFLDSDDWYSLNACEMAYNQITKNQNDLVIFNYEKFIQEKNTYENSVQHLKAYENCINNPKINLKKLTNFFKHSYCVTQIYLTDFIKRNNIQFKEVSFAEDVQFYVKSMILAKDISIIQDVLYFYRIRNDSTSSCVVKYWQNLVDTRYQNVKFIEQNEDGKYYIYPFLIYSINTMMYWYKKALGIDKTKERNLYKSIRKFFIFIDTQYDVIQIKDNIDYAHFKKICKNSYTMNKLLIILKWIFSINKIQKTPYKELIVAGIGFKIKYK